MHIRDQDTQADSGTEHEYESTTDNDRAEVAEVESVADPTDLHSDAEAAFAVCAIEDATQHADQPAPAAPSDGARNTRNLLHRPPNTSVNDRPGGPFGPGVVGAAIAISSKSICPYCNQPIQSGLVRFEVVISRGRATRWCHPECTWTAPAGCHAASAHTLGALLRTELPANIRDSIRLCLTTPRTPQHSR